MHEPAALFLFKLTNDPMLLDGIRVLNDKKATPKMVSTVKKYVEFKFAAYLNLYGNGDIELPYGLRYDQFDAPGEPE